MRTDTERSGIWTTTGVLDSLWGMVWVLTHSTEAMVRMNSSDSRTQDAQPTCLACHHDPLGLLAEARHLLMMSGIGKRLQGGAHNGTAANKQERKVRKLAT